jgi:hypothetical protein
MRRIFEMRARQKPKTPLPRFAFTINELVDAGGFGCRQTIYKLIQQGELEQYHQGRSTWITAQSVERLKAKLLALARQPTHAPNAHPRKPAAQAGRGG